MKRLDVYLVESGMIKSRTRAKNAVQNGNVSVNGKVCLKPSAEIDDCDVVTVEEAKEKYVSRAGYKLEKALDVFKVDVAGMTVLDIGASTGGFTDCLLQRGASFVYALDVGSGQLDPKLLGDDRVASLENTNAKNVKRRDFEREIDLIVMDVSFISQRKLYSNVSEILGAGKRFISLIKPQFELGRENVGKGGIVKNEKLFPALIDEIRASAEKCGLYLVDTAESPIRGGDGNKEFLGYFIRR